MSGRQWSMAGAIALTIAAHGTDPAAASCDPASGRHGPRSMTAPKPLAAAFDGRRWAESPVLQWPHGRIAQDTSGFDVETISAASGKAIPLRITLPKDGASPGRDGRGPAFVRIRGVPPGIALSAGFRLRDSWVISLRDVPTLWLSSPAGYDGVFEMEVTLQRGAEGTSETRIVSVNLGGESARLGRLDPHRLATSAPAHLPLPEPSFAPPPPPLRPPVAAAKPTLGALDRAEEAKLLERAGDILQRGDFEAARLIFVELAERGSALAAFRMAQTYDPRRLKGYFVVGLQPDVEEAKRWYQRASDLGDREATDRLSGLDGRN